MEETMPSLFTSLRSSSHKPLSSKKELEWLIMQDRFIQIHTDDYRQMVNIDRKAADNKKRNSAAICPSIQFKPDGRTLEYFGKPTYWAMLDYDHTPSIILEDAVEKAIKKPTTMVCYRTISGRGFRILLKYKRPPGCTLTETELHRLAITKAIKIYDELLNLNADRQCLDMTRLCGLAHDEKAYFNWDAEPLPLSPEEVTKFYQTVLKPEMEREKKLETDRANGTSSKGSRSAAKKSQGSASSGKANGKKKTEASTEDVIEQVKKLSEGWFCRFEPGSHHEFCMRFATFCFNYGAKKEELLNWMTAEYGSQYDGVKSIVDWVFNHTEGWGCWHLYTKGEKYGSNPSMKVLMQWLNTRYEMHLNTVTGMVEIRAYDTQSEFYYKWTEVTETVENTIYTLMDMDGLRTNKKRLESAIKSDFTKKFNPIEDYLMGLPEWKEGDPDYIDQLCERITVKEAPEYYHTKKYFKYAFRKWFVSMVYGWGSKEMVNELVLVLVGRGGIFKTKFLENLLPKCLRSYYANDSSADYKNKDFLQITTSKALICLDEFDAPHGKNLNSFKSCVTKRSVTIRVPYDKYPSQLLRHASLCGTSNNRHVICEEEDRRCLVWEVEKIQSPFEYPIDHDHIYAQAIYIVKELIRKRKEGKLKQGDWVPWLTYEDMEKQRLHNRMFLANSFLEELIAKYFRVPTDGDLMNPNMKFATSADIMEKIGFNPAIRNNVTSGDIQNVMEKMGFRRLRRKQGRGWIVIEKEGYDINQEAKLTIAESQNDSDTMRK